MDGMHTHYTQPASLQYPPKTQPYMMAFPLGIRAKNGKDLQRRMVVGHFIFARNQVVGQRRQKPK